MTEHSLNCFSQPLDAYLQFKSILTSPEVSITIKLQQLRGLKAFLVQLNQKKRITEAMQNINSSGQRRVLTNKSQCNTFLTSTTKTDRMFQSIEGSLSERYEKIALIDEQIYTLAMRNETSSKRLSLYLKRSNHRNSFKELCELHQVNQQMRACLRRFRCNTEEVKTHWSVIQNECNWMRVQEIQLNGQIKKSNYKGSVCKST